MDLSCQFQIEAPNFAPGRGAEICVSTLRASGAWRQHFSPRRLGLMVAEAPRRNQTVSDPLRHVDSMAVLPSCAGKIDHLNAVILGEALSSEENDLVCPSEDFSRQALVSSVENRISREALILTVRKQLRMAVGWVLRSELLKVETKKRACLEKSSLGQTRSFSSDESASPRMTAFKWSIFPSQDGRTAIESTCRRGSDTV